MYNKQDRRLMNMLHRPFKISIKDIKRSFPPNV